MFLEGDLLADILNILNSAHAITPTIVPGTLPHSAEDVTPKCRERCTTGPGTLTHSAGDVAPQCRELLYIIGIYSSGRHGIAVLTTAIHSNNTEL